MTYNNGGMGKQRNLNQMNEELIVQSVSNKSSTSGKKYVSVKTDKGYYSCWNPQLQDKFLIGSKIAVVVEVNNVNGKDFKNILGIDRVINQGTQSTPGEVKGELMKISYAKDILISMINKATPEKTDIEVLAKIAAQCIKTIEEELHEITDIERSDSTEDTE